MSHPAPVYIAIECRIEDSAAREAAHHAFDGFARGGDSDPRIALLHAHGVELDTPFDLGSDWLVDTVDATAAGSFRLAVELYAGNSDDFVESFLLVFDGLGAEDVTADLSDGDGRDMRLRVIDGSAIYVASVDEEDDVEARLDELELEESY